ncbi:glycosyltransferase family 2 protein [Sphingomonas sp. M1-B02]|uniref:glycosyltransferase family 2 protein n=1 Tax=Sphingomonas sp. M1-B02 TaxID=3114300 RepID=UPI002AD46A9C|nr:glycosyltransferase family 2 protein [Sphingomonas sp. S6-11]
MRCCATSEEGPVSAIVLHDAEDIVHPSEFRVFARHLGVHAAVQLPVVPLCHPASRFVSGHYCDEFSEAHAKQMLVRSAVGAGMPLAGVGCAIRRDMIGRIADARGGAPFDATSLTEDYELGLTIGVMGGRTLLARDPECPGGRPVAVRAYFPSRLPAAVRQKARWMTGIALAGWDRVGWGPVAGIGDHWMRMRDRRATLAIPVLVVAYCALVVWGLSLLGHFIGGSSAPALPPFVQTLLMINFGLLLWRLVVRAVFVWRAYDWRQAFWSTPRFLVSNYVSLLAARLAFAMYLRLLSGGAPKWDKTAHQFPENPEQATA